MDTGSDQTTAVVLLSGGQDSTTALYLAKQQCARVLAVSIDYGQRHAVELVAAEKIAKFAGVAHEVIRVGSLLQQVSTSALLKAQGGISGQHEQQANLPASFVPGRNMLFLTLAAMVAYKKGATVVYGGMCETDFSGYPDCRLGALRSLELALQEGMAFPTLRFEFPFMCLNKAQTVRVAAGIRGCLDALALSHTCYEGSVPPCGVCPACVLRAKGFEEAGVPDPILANVGQQ